jgi:hypothetical protein
MKTFPGTGTCRLKAGMVHLCETCRYGTLLKDIQIVFLAVPEFGLFDSKLKSVKILSRTDMVLVPRH